MDEEMSHNSPQSIAKAVYKALQEGGKLPYFDSTEEVRKALLDFAPNSSHPASENGDLDDGNDSLEQGKVRTVGKGKRKGEHLQEDHQCKKGKRKSRTAPTLMLEALSRRRMDAVQQLHEVCPQLLASFPLFDPCTGSQQLTRPIASQGSSTLWATPGASPAQASSDSGNPLLTSDPFPLRQRSYLLDMAAENKALLVFVLEQHPGISQQQLRPEAASRFNNLEDDEDGDNLNQLPDQTRNTSFCSRDLQAVGTESEQQSSQTDEDVFGIRFETRGNVNENEEEANREMQIQDLKGNENKESDSLKELDPTSPITICIKKNNIEVLRYLLYKHIWQHFLLDDIFKLNQVSDSGSQALSSSCPECTGFLPCAALTGYPYLLDLLLRGKFCTHSGAGSSQQSACCTAKHGDSALEIESQDGTTMRETLTDSLPERRFTSETENQESETGPSSDHDPDLCSDDENAPAFSPDSRALPPFSQLPDPNFQVPVSLPIMDRWISRCIHAKLAPLHLACWRCDPASIRVLLHHGAQVTLMAEELENSNVKQGSEGNVLDSGESRVASTPSSDSSLEQALNFVSVTINSSSFDVAASSSSAEDQLKRKRGANRETEHAVLSPLALLALGIRSPPDFSLSIGRSLGLVLPTLPVLWSGQTDRSCPQAKACLMEALHLLLDAGCNINQVSTVFGKTFSVIELFLQPSVDLYYAPLMPRGGRDSAVLRCMDLEHVADLVLSVCWELCSRGARLGTSFSGSLEWNLFRMDWMFLKNETVQRKFLHLATFLGLFPSLDPALLMDSLANRGKTGNLSAMTTAAQRKACASRGGIDITQSHFHPYALPPRPSCIPWAPSTSMTATPPLSNSSSTVRGEEAPVAPVTLGTEQLQQLQSTEVVTSYYSSVATQSSLPENRVATRADVHGDSSGAGSQASVVNSEGFMSEVSSVSSWGNDVSSSVIELRNSASDTRNSVSEEPPSTLNNTGGNVGITADSQDPSFRSNVDDNIPNEIQRRLASDMARENTKDPTTSGSGSLVSDTFNLQRIPSSARTESEPVNTSKPGSQSTHPSPSTSGAGTGAGGTTTTRGLTSSYMRAQMVLWALEERQRRCLEKFVNDMLRLSVPEHSLSLILSFMCMSDLRLLASITQHMLTTSPATTESTLQRLYSAVCHAQSRSLRHCCKLVILTQSGWRPSALDCLPLPDSLKRYLMDPQC